MELLAIHCMFPVSLSISTHSTEAFQILSSKVQWPVIVELSIGVNPARDLLSSQRVKVPRRLPFVRCCVRRLAR